MSKYILSTATCSQRFHDYLASVQPGGVNTSERSVLVKGGANSTSLTSGFGELTSTEEGTPLWTPNGVVTTVSDEDAAWLELHEGFQAAVERGFYKILAKDPGQDHAKIKKIVEADMTPRDPAAPMTSETAKTQVKVTTKLDKEE